MGNFGHLMDGFAVALTFHHVAIMVVGVLLGLIVGVLPGLGAPNGVSLLLPLTFTMNPISAIILLTSMYWGALFGGSTTSVLFNIPGEPSSVATTFDGYPMAKHGEPVRALTLAFASAAIGALTGVVVITLLSGWVAQFALRFGAAEYFAVYFMAFSSYIGMSGGSPFKSLVSMMLGFAVATIGHGHDLGGKPADLRDGRADRRHLLPGGGHRPVRHRRTAHHHGGEARIQRRQDQARPAHHLPHPGRDAALLGRDRAQRHRRLLDGDHAGRADRRLLHELFLGAALLPPRQALRHRRAGGASCRPRLPTIPPARARSCPCWRSAFRARRPPP